LILQGEKVAANKEKFMQYEWDRIETTKLSLMHFANANMYLHARGLEICSQVYDALNKLNFENEFEDADSN
jgi:hypothetical protein